MPLPPALVERYHLATKYAPASLGGLPAPDPSAQPPTFKTWHQARPLALPRSLGLPARHPGPRLDVAGLGRLLLHTYGITAVGQVPGHTQLYRAAPSAGGLYPAELYASVHDVPGVPDGVYAYLAREHALAACWEGDFRTAIARCAFDHPAIPAAQVVLIATGVFQRSAWRYHDRAYRRVLLDVGHMLGNAVLAAPSEGVRVVPVADFADDALDGLLLLDPAQEATLLLGVVVPAPAPTRTALRSPVLRNGAEPAPGAWIRHVHDAARMHAAEPPHPLHLAPGPEAIAPEVPLPDAPLANGAEVLEAIRRRRSTRQFRRATLALADLGRILAQAYPRNDADAPVATIAPDVLETWVVVAAVEGLAPGAYRYEPARHALALVRAGDPRRALQHACLGQDLAADGAFAVVHACNLGAAVARYGERAYRYVHLEAGLIGERLNLAALRLGHGASGIGGFFDDDTARLLGLEPEHAIVYVTMVGAPATA